MMDDTYISVYVPGSKRKDMKFLNSAEKEQVNGTWVT